MKFAIYIVGTEGLKNKLEDELSYMQVNISITELVKPIEELIKSLNRNPSYLYVSDTQNKISQIRNKCILLETDPAISKDKKINIFDMFAIKIRSIAIDLHNKHEKFKEAQLLINFALELAMSQRVKNICLQDLQVVNKTVENRCGFNGFMNSQAGGCLVQIISYGIVYLIIIGISALFGG